MDKKNAVLFSICGLLFLSMIAILTMSHPNNNSIHADYPNYQDTDAMVENAEVIIDGKVIKEEGAKKININLSNKKEEDLYNTYTVFQIEVQDVIKGDLKVGDVIAVKQLGDKYRTKNVETDKAGYFAEGQETILFLVSYKDENPNMPYSTINPAQGSIIFQNNKQQLNNENPLISSKLSKEEIIRDLKERVENQQSK